MRVDSSRIAPRRVKELIRKTPQQQVVARPVDNSFMRSNIQANTTTVENYKLLKNIFGDIVKVTGMVSDRNNDELRKKGKQDATLGNAPQTDGFSFFSNPKVYGEAYMDKVDELQAIGFEAEYRANMEANDNYANDPEGMIAMQEELATKYFNDQALENPWRQKYSNGKPIIGSVALDRLSNTLNSGHIAHTSSAAEYQHQQLVQADIGILKDMATKAQSSEAFSVGVHSILAQNMESGVPINEQQNMHNALEGASRAFDDALAKGDIQEAERILTTASGLQMTDGRNIADVITNNPKKGQRGEYGFKDRLDGLENALAKAKQAKVAKGEDDNNAWTRDVLVTMMQVDAAQSKEERVAGMERLKTLQVQGLSLAKIDKPMLEKIDDFIKNDGSKQGFARADSYFSEMFAAGASYDELSAFYKENARVITDKVAFDILQKAKGNFHRSVKSSVADLVSAKSGNAITIALDGTRVVSARDSIVTTAIINELQQVHIPAYIAEHKKQPDQQWVLEKASGLYADAAARVDKAMGKETTQKPTGGERVRKAADRATKNEQEQERVKKEREALHEQLSKSYSNPYKPL